MFANSRPVISQQNDIHPRLHALVARRRQHPLRRPVAAPAAACFEQLAQRLAGRPAPLLIDAGCGSGESSRRLAGRYPQHWVIGIDKSAQRLARGGCRDALMQAGNCILLHMHLEDFYMLAGGRGWPVKRQYFLYPNPWPKPKHIQRRWHAHAAFPLIMALGGELELRSNWLIYVQEFIAAIGHYRDDAVRLSLIATRQPPASPFERKYAASGQGLYRCLVVGRQADPQLTPN